jgi:glycerol-3-phosphate O-acyltransferase
MEFSEYVLKLRDEIKKMKDAGKVRTAPNMESPVSQIIVHGIDNIGIYHHDAVLKFTESGDVETEDMKLLYYYHNRLNGYGLHKFF